MGNRAFLIILAAAGLGGLWPANAAQVSLAWDPVPGATGYILSRGTNSGSYNATTSYPSNQTSVTLTNLPDNQAFYFAVQSKGSQGGLSDYSAEAQFAGPSQLNLAPPPPLPPPPVFTNTVTTQGTTNVANSAPPPPPPTNVQTYVTGVPPRLAFGLGTNRQASLFILGTVGATVAIQTSTNPAAAYSWTTITNLALSNAAPPRLVQANPSVPAMVSNAFVPALATFDAALSNQSPGQFYRVVMPYDYPILASLVLGSQGLQPRLVLVRMAGSFNDDVCYVPQDSSFINCDPQTYLISYDPSGSTIRQIATTLANSLTLNWTTASEFTYTNGAGQSLATVVQTDPPSSDPVAGQQVPSPIVIDF